MCFVQRHQTFFNQEPVVLDELLNPKKISMWPLPFRSCLFISLLDHNFTFMCLWCLCPCILIRQAIIICILGFACMYMNVYLVASIVLSFNNNNDTIILKWQLPSSQSENDFWNWKNVASWSESGSLYRRNPYYDTKGI